MKELHEIKKDKRFATLIDGLTEEVAKSVLKTMVVGDEVIREIFLKVLSEDGEKRVGVHVDIEELAEDVFYALENIDPMECWQRSGKKTSGKDQLVVDSKAASAMFDEVMKPYTNRLKLYHKQGHCDAESDYLKGIFRGINHFEKNHTNQLFELIDPSLLDYIGVTENEWSFRHSGNEEYLEAFREYAKIHLPDWEFIFSVEEWEEDLEDELLESEEI